jgi:tetratricopeptide (TPR) repeat protein
MYEEAVAEYKQTISLNDQHQLAYYNLGYIYFNNLKCPQEGVQMLKKCLEIDPTDVDAQINMALAFNDLGMIDDVIKSYKYIIEHNSKSVMAHFNLGMIRWQQDLKLGLLSKISCGRHICFTFSALFVVCAF